MTYKANATYTNFLKRWEEVTNLPPQTLGPFTGMYKLLTGRFKVMPWPWFLVVSAVFVVVLYVILGSAIAFLVTTLQKGF